MKPSISHGWSEETIEAKARWFQSLTMEERMDVFCEFYELALALNPQIAEEKRVKQFKGRIRVLSREDLIASKGNGPADGPGSHPAT